MAYSHVAYTGDGATTAFTVPFPFLERSHVAVTVAGVSTSFTWVSDGQITISPAPANGTTVRISRSSSRDTRLSDYQDAQVLTEEQLDYDARQIFYVAQEAFDAVSESEGGGDMLRSMNLSDVYSTAAARSNIGALGKAGDTMTGRLYLTGSPVAPNEAATKAYVDSRVGGASTVTSFNARTGAVTLNGGDVTTAIGYIPVNKAGDTMTGMLTLAGAPTTALHAATKAYVDSRTAGSVNTYDWVFNAPANDRSAVQVNKTQTNNVGAYSGLADLKLTRAGSGVSMTAFPIRYYITGSTVANSDIGSQIIVRGDNVNGGGLIGQQIAVAGPKSNTGSRALVGLQVGSVERAGDQGRKLNWLGTGNTGILVYPQSDQSFEDGSFNGYNASFGIAITSAPTVSSATGRTHVPLLIDVGATAHNGYSMLVHGQTSASNNPESPLHVRGYYTYGIDLTNATFTHADGPFAIRVAQEAAIGFGGPSKIYTDASGNLSFYDSVAGGPHSLQSLLGGSGVNLLPLDNVWTGKNTWNKLSGAYPAYTGAFNSGTLSPSGASILLTSNYSTAVDVRKETNAGAEYGTAGGIAGLYLQHNVSGVQPAVATTYVGIRAQMEGSHAGNGTQSDLAGAYFGVNNKGSNLGAFGVHVDAYHASSSGGTTYGSSVEAYRTSAQGAFASYLTRAVPQQTQYADVAYGITGQSAAFSKDFHVGFQIGGLFGYSTRVGYGLDMAQATILNAAISIPTGSKITFSNSREAGPWMHYNAGLPGIVIADSSYAGSQDSAFAVVTNGDYRGRILVGDGFQSALGNYWIDVASFAGSAVMSIQSNNKIGSAIPGASSSIKILIDGNVYRIPVYAGQ